MTRRARVKTNAAPVTRKQAAAAFDLKKAKQRRQQWKRRVLLMTGVSVLACGGISSAWLLHTGALQHAVEASSKSLWQWTADAGLRVDQVYLEGRTHADAAVVKSAIRMQQGAPILALPLAEIKARLEAIPEVKSVTVTRVLPNRVMIAMIERTPSALWQHESVQQLIDGEGVVLRRDNYRDTESLPVVVGDDAPRHVAELLALLDSAPSIKPDVVAAIRVGHRRWNVQLKRGVVVMLPEDNPSLAWKRFAALVEEKALLAKAVRSIDMRMEDRVFIMPIEENKSPITLTTARDT